MRVTSERHAAAYASGATPAVEQGRDGIFAIAVPMTAPSLPYSFCYAIESGDGRLHLVDTGVDTDDNWNHLARAIRSIGYSVDDVATVSVTHLHIDHAGLAARIRATSGARVGMHVVDDRAARDSATFVPVDVLEETLERWEVPVAHREEVRTAASRLVASEPRNPVDRPLVDGELVDVGRGSIRVLHVPGHTAGHVAFAMDDERLVFAGDHLLPIMFAGIGLGGRNARDNPVGDYLRSLAAMSELDGYEVLPGHGYRFEGVAERCEVTRAHHELRSKRIAELMEQVQGQSAWTVASQLEWTGGWQALRGTHLFSALAQAEMHMENLRR